MTPLAAVRLADPINFQLATVDLFLLRLSHV